MTAEQMADVVHSGRGRMPAFTLQGDNLSSLLAFVGSGEPIIVRCQNTSAQVDAYAAGEPLRVLLGPHAVQVLRD